jgi:hypothetical protein
MSAGKSTCQPRNGIQNAADLQWPATDPANAGVRNEFWLNSFPPSGGSAPPTPPPVAPAK